MKKFKFTRNNSLAIAFLISVSILLWQWLISPVLPSMAKTPAGTFDRVWQTVNENFYDPNFLGVDWKAMQSKYKRMVTKAKSNEEMAATINQMLSELNTSHTYYYIPSEPAYYQVLGIFGPRLPDLQKQLKNIFPTGKIEYSGIGIFTKEINGNTFIKAILDGSPASQTGLKVGDRILGVDDRPFEPIQSFAGKAGKQVKIKIQRSQTPNSQQEITVTPKMLDTTTMFLSAQQASTQVIERQGKKIGYVHMWSYADDQYQQQLEDDLIYGRLRNADALILDLREGWGGAPLGALNMYMIERGLSLTNVPRNGKRSTYYSNWNKPVVMIVNEGSRSAKEVLAYGFQQYKIGPVVGTKTAGAVVAGRPFLMPDNSLLYVAIADVYVDNDKRLEGEGVTPDIVVPFSPEYAQGADPQKEKAIEVALEATQQKS